MKLKLLLVAASVAFTMSGQAAQYFVSNVVTGTGASEALFQGTTDKGSPLLSGGIVSMGYFPAGYTISSSLADINLTINNFTSVASMLAGTPSDSLGGSFPGYVEGPQVQGPIITVGNPLIGRALYVFVGNAATLSGSSDFALKQIGTIADDVPFENQYFANPLGGSAPVIGTIGTFAGNASGLGPSPYSTLQLVTNAIPEPSAALLGAFGALGLLRRRRN